MKGSHGRPVLSVAGAAAGRAWPQTMQRRSAHVNDALYVARPAEARWLDPEGAWTYGEFSIESIAYDVSRDDAPRR